MRVESSKNRLTTVRPRSAGSFFTGRAATAAIWVATSRRPSISARLTSADESRCGIEESSPVVPGPFVVAGREIATSSTPSTSTRRTVTCSVAEVGGFLPTWSARIGSSRWPRSTRTASRTAAGTRGGRLGRGQPDGGRRTARRRPGRPPCRRPRRARRCDRRERIGGLRRSSRYMVMSSDPPGTRTPSTSKMRAARLRGDGGATGGDPSNRSAAGALSARGLVGDAGESSPMASPSRTTRSSAGMRARCGTSAIPSRLTGRAVKGWLFGLPETLTDGRAGGGVRDGGERSVSAGEAAGDRSFWVMARVRSRRRRNAERQCDDVASARAGSW